MSAAALAEYLILRPDGQQNILHDSKYSRPPIVTANGEAVRALRAYNQDPRRSQDTLLRVKDTLTIKSEAPGIMPKQRDEALRCLEIIDLFERNENALGMRSMALSAAPTFGAIEIEGVMVSVRPDFIVGGGGGRSRVGAAILRVAKAPDPAGGKRPETRQRRGEIRREMARYMVAMQQLLLEAQDGAMGVPDRDLCFVADVRLGERIGPAADNAVRLRDIRGACRQIASLWETVSPKPSLLKKT
ncbi:hypothetical protein [Bradyrhizobium manausense]|uniref:hypothetical protein n=1 Tax=Bradyrhizobium manausense TaxID=989370 RepID=UPI001BA8F0D0|nr:hypothetical protein [Bradyrhizobium manausense]MBR0722055.1 hypothetical protein [Bradyrhizobium manausense]